MVINACFDKTMQMMLRNTVLTNWAMEPFMMFMNGSKTFEQVKGMGRTDDCFMKFSDITLPAPVEEDCCDPNECFGTLKETQFNTLGCESFVYRSKKIALPIGLDCVPAVTLNHGLLSYMTLQKKFLIWVLSKMPSYILQMLYQNVWACDQMTGSKPIDYVQF